MNKYRCNKCGLEVEQIPTEHGVFKQAYNLKNKPVKQEICSGTFILITNERLSQLNLKEAPSIPPNPKGQVPKGIGYP
jgi:hypothetical protein